MGSGNAKPETKIKGNEDLTIIQTQNIHTEQHLSQDAKINILIILLSVIIVCKVLKAIYKFLSKQAHDRALKILSLPK